MFGQYAVSCIGIQSFKIAAVLRANLLPISILRPARNVVDARQLSFAGIEFLQGGVIEVVEDVFDLNRA
jgi:hypothetical protein